MKYLFITSIAFLSILFYSAQGIAPAEQPELYPICHNGQWGFINEKGEEVIEPQFRMVGNFSEGMASARLEGTYGYVDNRGEFVIPPIYDAANNFVDGLAKVYLHGKPLIIDKLGKVQFEHDFTEIHTPFNEHGITSVRTKGEKYGLINLSGELVHDTTWVSVKWYSDNLAVVGVARDENKWDEINGVINGKGEYLAPMDTYERIGDFKNGYSDVIIKPHGESAVIDTLCNIVCVEPVDSWKFPYDFKGFHEDLATVSFDEYEYCGVINKKGELIFADKRWETISNYSHGRAFAKDQNDSWYLLDSEGKVLNSEPYEEIVHDSYFSMYAYLFHDEIEFVKIDGNWHVIDLDGNIVSSPEIEGYSRNFDSRAGNYVIQSKDVSTERLGYSFVYGLFNLKTGEYIPPEYTYIDRTGMMNNLFYVKDPKQAGYLSHTGKFIRWKKRKTSAKSNFMNVDYMNRGYYYAGSSVEDKESLGGYGSSQNLPKEIKSSMHFLPDTLAVYVDLDSKAVFAQTFVGKKLYIYNTTGVTQVFSAQDSRLYMKIQAIDTDGEWKNIEYLPSSWCGNSYHKVSLNSGEYWEFTMPVYEGSYPTKLRAELFSETDDKVQMVYSNEFDGSINPAQFWKKNAYSPKGLMDPYND